MKNIDVEELKKIQIDILDYFDAFCKKNGINYWLDYGTLLGAIRHHGYIPWDDDIDIGMLRADYLKAETLFNQQSNGKYMFSTPVNDKSYCYPFGKIIQTNTVLFEYGTEGVKTGVYVDVFPYDNSPKDIKIVKRMFRARDYLGRIRRLQLPMREGLSLKKKTLYKLGAMLFKLIPKNSINRLIDRKARKYEGTDTGMVSSFTDTYETRHLSVPRTLFENFVEVEFEGKKYPAPSDYDFWLSSFYGDYMTLPPEEQRVPHHVFEAYYKQH